uniref:THH1/TOM1/TOM3 domain-containing protein n=1 Tax=Sexangularia sp. CB-2014 TaxID=1486929 RepID=A0A7S1YEU1_9EUKA
MQWKHYPLYPLFTPTVWSHPYFNYSHLILAVLYACLGLLGLASVLLLQFGPRRSTIRWQLGFCVVIVVGSIGRVFLCILSVPLREGMLHDVLDNRVMIALVFIPSLAYFINYLIILFLWAEIYHTSRQEIVQDPSLTISKLAPLFKRLVGAMLLLFLGLFTADFAMYKAAFEPVSVHTNAMEVAITVIVACMYLIASGAFLVYGVRFYAELVRAGTPIFTKRTRRQRIVAEVQMITVTLAIAFIVRATLTLYQLFTPRPISSVWYTDIVYFTCTEVLPLLLLLITVRPRIPTQTYRNKDDDSFSPIINTSYE